MGDLFKSCARRSWPCQPPQLRWELTVEGLMTRDYYNRRIGRDAQRPNLTLRETTELVAEAYTFLDQQGYLQRSFGFFCVDEREVAGRDGYELHKPFLLETGIRIEGSVSEALKTGDEIFLFTLIEFVHDHVAKPVAGGWHHSFSGCGWHYRQDDKFDECAARDEWRTKCSKALKYYDGGYQLSEAGEILRIAPDGMTPLLHAELPSKTNKTDREKVSNAVRTFQLGRSTRQERKQAVRDLVDVLEFHRPHVKKHLFTKDESDIFNMANNFALRHHNSIQKDDYDDTFLTWIFFLYLSTVHLILGRVTGETAFVSKSPSVSPPLVADLDDLPF